MNPPQDAVTDWPPRDATHRPVANGSAAVGGLLGQRYRLVARVGAGGMATIFRGRDESLERDVAVKVLHAHLADDPVLLQRFRTEARHAAALIHPHIVNVFDQGVADLPYIVMEFVDGPSVREVLLERGRLTPSEALAIIEPVCAALTRAHGAGVVHRDIKPENLLVAPDGTVKVADFGIARAVAATSHTTTGTLIGSVHYLAPELVNGREATPASDQYAVGVLLFELLTGRKPLPADSPMAIALRHAREDLPPPSAHASDVPRALDRVVAQATARQAGRRYPGVAALAAAMRGAVPEGPSPIVLGGGGSRGNQTLVIPAEIQETLVPAPRTQPRPASHRRPPQRDRGGRRDHRRPRGPRPARARSTARRFFTGLLFALLLLGGLAGGAYALWDQVIAPQEAVPVLTGGTLEDAVALAQDAGLLVVTGEENTLEVAAGVVMAQVPSPDTLLRRGESVSLTVSAGPAQVTMPRVIGITEDEAVALLEGGEYVFELRIDREFSDGVPAGQVQGQIPDAGDPVRQAAQVVINVSMGIQQVEVPDLDGLDREQAAAALAENMLAPSFVEEFSDDVPTAGDVVAQSIAPDATVDKDTVVTVTISLGPRTFALPDVVGFQIADATAELEASGLEVNAIPQPQNRIGPFRTGELGVVTFTEPGADDAVSRGDTVDVYFYSDDV